jgi:hypothetical protein
MPSKSNRKISSTKLRAIIEKTFDEFPDMDQRKDGMHEPHLYSVNNILRQVLAKMDPEMAHSYEKRAPYWTKENAKKVYKALVAFYKERGVLASKFKKLKFSRTPDVMRAEAGKKLTGKKESKKRSKSRRKSSKRRKSKSGSSKRKTGSKKKKSKRKRCPSGKIRNPASGRCVDVNGAIGKKLMKKRQSRSKSK